MKRLLIVEDKESLASMLKETVEAEGSVVVADSVVFWVVITKFEVRGSNEEVRRGTGTSSFFVRTSHLEPLAFS
jgi:hypothetical protein